MCFTQRFKLLLSLNTTKLLRQQPLPMKMEKHGILLNKITWCLTTRVITVLQKKGIVSSPIIDVTYFYDDVSLAANCRATGPFCR